MIPRLLCLICGERSNDLVEIQEHVMSRHGYTQNDLRRQKRHELKDGWIWSMPDRRNWLWAGKEKN
jgi:hypothetical protein